MSSPKSRTFVSAIALRLLCDLATVSAVWNLDDWDPASVNLDPVPRSSNLHYWDPDFLKHLGLYPNDLDLENPATNNLELLPPLSDNLGEGRSHTNYWYSWFSPPLDSRNPLGYNPSNYLDPWNSPGSNPMDSWGPWRSHPSYLDSFNPPGSNYMDSKGAWRSRSNYLDSGSDSRDMKTLSLFTYPRPKYWVPQANSEMKKHRDQHYSLGPMVDIQKLRPLAEQESDGSQYPIKCWYKYGHSHKYCSD